ARVGAITELVTEEDISELLAPSVQPGETKTERRQWAVLPQLGYGPDTGPLAGVKFTHRDVLHTGITFDLDALYAALNQQEHFSVKIAQPHFDGDRFLITLWGQYRFDPQREYFGLGNNNRGPDPASTNAFQEAFGVLTFGWRPFTRLALNF